MLIFLQDPLNAEGLLTDEEVAIRYVSRFTQVVMCRARLGLSPSL